MNDNEQVIIDKLIKHQNQGSKLFLRYIGIHPGYFTLEYRNEQNHLRGMEFGGPYNIDWDKINETVGYQVGFE